MSGVNPVQELNRELADKINEEALKNPQSPYANKFVGIANGQVVVVANDLGEMFDRLRQIEPDPSKTMSVEASRDYSVVEEIGGPGVVRDDKPVEDWSMTGNNSVQTRNRQLADQINAEARSNPQSPYANKFVGIANGQVVVVADDLGEMFDRLRLIEPDPSKTFGVEASRDYDEVHEIWELH
jgi:hypothetical protein